MIVASLMASVLSATPISPAALKNKTQLVLALGKPCAVSYDKRTKHHLYWYIAKRCDEGWCLAKCTHRSGPEFPWWFAYAFEMDGSGRVVDSAPPANEPPKK